MPREYWTRISFDIVFRSSSDEDAVEIAKDIEEALLNEIPRVDETVVNVEQSQIEQVAEGDRVLMEEGEEVDDEDEDEDEEDEEED